MTVTPPIAITQWVAFLVCAGIGYLIARPLPPPEKPMLWFLLIAVVFVIGYLPPLMFPVVIFGAQMQFSMLLWGLGVGLVVGLMLKRDRAGRAQ